MRKIYLLSICLVYSFLSGTDLKAQTPPSLWGLSPAGGDGLGTLFSINTGSTAISTQYNFQGYPGNAPFYVKLCQASNGKLYGTTRFGGVNNLGTLFEFNPATNSYSVLVNFDGTTKELATKAKITPTQADGPDEEPIGSALITLVSNYWGRGPSEMWEWLTSRWDHK